VGITGRADHVLALLEKASRVVEKERGALTPAELGAIGEKARELSAMAEDGWVLLFDGG